MSNENNKWRKTPEAPNLEGTDVGKLVENLKTLQAHYEGDLQEQLGNLAFLEQAIGKLVAQKRRRKADPNG
jgi:hypothetical protein